jgi:DNA-binding transcriptional LysR family regulator
MGQTEKQRTDLNEILVFAKVIQAGSFVGAARELGMPKSTVSRKVSELEERLGARLLQRTTRKLSLTDAGRTYHQYAARVVTELEAAELAVTRMQEAPRGLLRVTMPLNFGYFGPIVTSFLKRYPDVQVELVCTDRVLDLIHDGFDVALRTGQLADSSLIARHLGTLKSFVVASPRFLKQRGTPQKPEDLAQFECVVFGAGSDRASWKLHKSGRTLTVEVRARLWVNDFDFLDEAARAGLGIAMLPAFRCVEPMRSHTLRRVLPDWCSPEIALHAVYPSTRHLSPKVKAFLDHLSEQMAQPPWERKRAP